jgi:integrase
MGSDAGHDEPGEERRARRAQSRAPREGSIQHIAGRNGYRAQISLPDGRRPVRQFRTKQDAAAWLAEQRALSDAGKLVGPSAITLDGWMHDWLANRHRAPNTLAHERTHFKTHFGPIKEVRLDRLTTLVCRRWLEGLDSKFHDQRPPLGQPHTLRHCYNLLRTALDGAIEHRLLASNPMLGIPRPKLPKPAPKFLTEDEVARLIPAVNRTGDPRAIAVHLMLRLGLRRGEALGLTWDALDLEDGTIRISHQLQRIPDPERDGHTELKRVAPKTQGSVRELVCDPSLLELLRKLRRSAPGTVDEGHFVVCFFDGDPVDPDATTAWLRTVGRSVGVAATPHKLRHTAATMMLNHDVAITTVSSVLGHTDIRTTSNYARVLDDTKRSAIEALGRALEVLPRPPETRST